MGWALVIVLASIAATMGLMLFLYAPVYPSISVTFRITTSTQFSITIGPTSYTKASSYARYTVTLGEIVLSRLDQSTGSTLFRLRFGTETVFSQRRTSAQ